jgi:hypothetical protein
MIKKNMKIFKLYRIAPTQEKEWLHIRGIQYLWEKGNYAGTSFPSLHKALKCKEKYLINFGFPSFQIYIAEFF